MSFSTLDLAGAAERERAARAAAWLAAPRTLESPGAPPAAEVEEALRALARRIDHTLLAPDATPEKIDALCDEALLAGLFAVCVSPLHVARAAARLAGKRVTVATVVGFPSGAHETAVKVFETDRALSAGAGEIDMVLPAGLLRAGEAAAVAKDIAAVVSAAKGRLVKVILETARLSTEEKRLAARLAREAGAAFVKTSTGFGPGGATEEDVELLRGEAGDAMGVKASGGIRTAREALRMIACGADRIGTSAGARMLADARARPESP